MDKALKIERLEKSIEGRIVLEKINMQIDRGWLGIVGNNGAGKSTLLRCIGGLYRIDRGNVEVHGINVRKRLREARQIMSMSPGVEELPRGLTGDQALRLMLQARGVQDLNEKAARLAEAFEFGDFKGRLIAEYSEGMRQKLAILLSLSGMPSLLIYDEVFASLDVVASHEFKRFLVKGIASGDFSVVLATHSLDLVEQCCTNVVLVQKGRIQGQWKLEDIREKGLSAGFLERFVIEKMRGGSAAVAQSKRLDPGAIQ